MTVSSPPLLTQKLPEMRIQLAGMVYQPVYDQQLNAEKNKSPAGFKISPDFLF